MRKVIISLAPVEAGVPIHKFELIQDILPSIDAGAAVCHLHCHKEDGSLTSDITE